MQLFNNDICFHNIAHLLTAIFYGNKNPFSDNIIALSLDAGPDSMFEENAYEKQYYSGAVVKNGKLEIFSIESPARLWSYPFKKFGLREGTLMALATATNVEYYNFDYSKYDNISFYNEEARGNSQYIVEDICKEVFSINKEEIGIRCSAFDDRFSEQDNYISMIMKIISKLSERMVFKQIDNILKKYDMIPEKTIIAIAGGFALNCPTNSAILKKYNFKGYQIPPCASDTGIALGVGLAAFYPLLSTKQCFVDLNSAYYGQYHGGINGIDQKLKRYIESIEEVNLNNIAEDLVNNVIVWVNGNSEIGPRALGNRSLLGDPRFQEVKDKLNNIKKRQWWRPVAPLILDEYGDEYFIDYCYSPYMLLNLNVKENKRDEVVAILHHDNTARIQSVSSNSNNILYNLMQEFYKITNMPLLCNTSLNDAGEPIINNINEAIEFALQKGLTAIYVDGRYKVNLKLVSEKLNKGFNMRELSFHSPDMNLDIEKFVNDSNPYNLTLEELTYYYDNPNYFKTKKLTNKNDIEYIKQKTNEYLLKYPNGLKR